MAKDPFSGHLDMLLLSALHSRAMHGYGVIEYVREASAGQFDYAEGTIYPALRQLEDDGLVRSSWGVTEGRQRRTYTITARGRRALAAHRQAWESFSKGIETVLNRG